MLIQHVTAPKHKMKISEWLTKNWSTQQTIAMAHQKLEHATDNCNKNKRMPKGAI